MKAGGWGIVDKDGNTMTLMEEVAHNDKGFVESFLPYVDKEDPVGSPHRVVEPFYKEKGE